LQTVIDELPPGLTPKLAPISTGLGEIYYYVVEYAPTRPTSPPRARRS
jgi:cobalt-zinc-cadmium resistance protein CzcA